MIRFHKSRFTVQQDNPRTPELQGMDQLIKAYSCVGMAQSRSRLKYNERQLLSMPSYPHRAARGLFPILIANQAQEEVRPGEVIRHPRTAQNYSRQTSVHTFCHTIIVKTFCRLTIKLSPQGNKRMVTCTQTQIREIY